MIEELFSLAGRTALITGGNSGLGRAMALGFQSAGAMVAVTGRNPAKNQAVGEALGHPELVFSLDVREEAAVERTIIQVVDRLGSLDILVNNAGLFQGGPLLELSRADWDAVIDTHLTGSLLCAKYAARAMVARGQGGKIINIGSMFSIFGGMETVNYTAAKTGVLGLTRALAVELAPHHIQVNAILPGWYETDMTAGMPASPRGEQIRRKTAAGRWGEPEEMVGTAIFLASAASNFVTGVSIPVDGGYAITERLWPE